MASLRIARIAPPAIACPVTAATVGTGAVHTARSVWATVWSPAARAAAKRHLEHIHQLRHIVGIAAVGHFGCGFGLARRLCRSAPGQHQRDTQHEAADKHDSHRF